MDIHEHARLAQRILVGGGLDPQRVRVSTYRDRVDFAALEAVNERYVQGQAPESHPEGSWLSFVFSKPGFEEGDVRVHALEALDADGLVREVWLKAKRREAFGPEFALGTQAHQASAADVNGALWGWACEAYGADPARRDGVCFDPDESVASGPDWLYTPLHREQRGAVCHVRCPVLATPLDVSPRFAGMHYIKLVAPAWARAQLQR